MLIDDGLPIIDRWWISDKFRKAVEFFSENYFYKELVYADLKFTPTGGTEIELADLIINLEDIILAIQLKERNEKDRTQDKNIEEKRSIISQVSREMASGFG